MHNNELGFLYLRGALFNGKYHSKVKEIFTTTYYELLSRKSKDKYNVNIINFMIGMMDLAQDELDKGNLMLAGYDINILHNLPETIYDKWDKNYFYQRELLGYMEHMADANRCDKINKIIELESNTLNFVSSTL